MTSTRWAGAAGLCQCDKAHAQCSHTVRPQIDADVKEAKGILAYMRRCCLCFLFSCCCDCDPSKQADATRAERVQMCVLHAMHVQPVFKQLYLGAEAAGC